MTFSPEPVLLASSQPSCAFPVSTLPKLSPERSRVLALSPRSLTCTVQMMTYPVLLADPLVTGSPSTSPFRTHPPARVPRPPLLVLVLVLSIVTTDNNTDTDEVRGLVREARSRVPCDTHARG